MSEATNGTGLWQVFDTNQGGHNQPPRIHEVGGAEWPMFRHQGCPMPQHIAAVFLRDKAFKVLDENGVEQTTLPQVVASGRTSGGIRLEPGQTVAKFSELTHSALLARVAVRPGGDEFNSRSKRDDMIAWLESAPEVVELAEWEKPRGTGSPAEGADADEMTEAETDKLLGPKPADVTTALMGG